MNGALRYSSRLAPPPLLYNCSKDRGMTGADTT